MIKNGKLFGKLNIIDLLILVLVICLLVFVGMKLAHRGEPSVSAQQTMRITFYAEEIADYVIEKTTLGDDTWDLDCQRSLGPVVELRTTDSVSYATDANGKTILSPKPGYKAVWITCEVQATPTDHGAVIGSTIYAAGHSVVLYAGDGKYYVKVYDTQVVN